MAGSKESRVFGLDALRAAAIAAVVLAHGGISFVLIALLKKLAPSYAAYGDWFFLLGHGGTLGVEMFFVLSGFLIGAILLRMGENIGRGAGLPRFYTRRWLRTLPLFALALAANVVFERWYRHHPLSWAEIATHGLFVRNFAHFSFSFFPESWSLAVEEWFYLLFPAALALGVILWRTRFDRVFLVCALAFFVFSFAARVWGAFQPGATWEVSQRCIVIYRFDALMTGILAAWLAARFPVPWRRVATPCAILGVLLFLGTYATFWKLRLPSPAEAPDSFFARTYRFNLLSLSIALLLPWLSTWAPARERIWHVSVRKIALWSYALYLVHSPIIQLARAPWFAARETTALGLIAVFVGEMLVAVVVAALLYRCYERPFMRLRDRLRFGAPRRTAEVAAEPSGSGDSTLHRSLL